MLRLHLVVVITTAIVALGSVLFMTSRVDQQSRLTAAHSNAAVLAAQTQADLREPVSILFVTAYVLLSSEAMAGVPEEAREALLDGVLTQMDNVGQQPLQFPVPAIPAEISERHAFQLHTGIHSALHRIDELQARGGGDVDLAPVIEERAKLEASLTAYLETRSLADFRDTFQSLVVLGGNLSDASNAYQAELVGSQSALTTTTDLARGTLIVALALLAMAVLFATYFVGRLIHRAFIDGEAERAHLRETSETLTYRNDQLNALYNVFAEISDTLSVRYVIDATLRETLRVMRATFVTLRLLRGNQLVAVGTLSADGEEPELPPVPLGEGPTGRVARRGRSMRIDYGAQDVLGQSTNPEKHVESGIIAPLIVGARIVGTLACWSEQKHGFQDQDERVLEMMASQVATAVVAADTTETLERRSLSDPLTNLPNRRQLTEDMTLFTSWRREGRRAVVAMMDIDHFKQLNDDFGHKVGDVTLQKVAAVMRQAIRDTDRIYRYGGEEFVVIFDGAGDDEAYLLAERVLRAVAETPLTGDSLEPVGPITLSAGLALMPEHGDDVAELLVLADRAMYRAKQTGRNRIQVWDESMPRTVTAA